MLQNVGEVPGKFPTAPKGMLLSFDYKVVMQSALYTYMSDEIALYSTLGVLHVDESIQPSLHS